MVYLLRTAVIQQSIYDDPIIGFLHVVRMYCVYIAGTRIFLYKKKLCTLRLDLYTFFYQRTSYFRFMTTYYT